MIRYFFPERLSEYEEIFIPDGETLRAEIKKYAKKLRKSRIPFRERNLYTVRGYIRTEYWAVAFVDAEAEELRDFVSKDKRYDVYLLRNLDEKMLEIVIRLSTLNLDGYTQYGIKIIRCGEDEYAGRE